MAALREARQEASATGDKPAQHDGAKPPQYLSRKPTSPPRVAELVAQPASDERLPPKDGCSRRNLAFHEPRRGRRDHGLCPPVMPRPQSLRVDYEPNEGRPADDTRHIHLLPRRPEGGYFEGSACFGRFARGQGPRHSHSHRATGLECTVAPRQGHCLRAKVFHDSLTVTR